MSFKPHHQHHTHLISKYQCLQNLKLSIKINIISVMVKLKQMLDYNNNNNKKITHNFPKSSKSVLCLCDDAKTFEWPSRKTLCKTWQNFQATIRCSWSGNLVTHRQKVSALFSWYVPIIASKMICDKEFIKETV